MAPPEKGQLAQVTVMPAKRRGSYLTSPNGMTLAAWRMENLAALALSDSISEMHTPPSVPATLKAVTDV